MTSSGGMLPRLTSGPNCFTNQDCEAFVGASKMMSPSVDRVDDLVDQAGTHLAVAPVDAGGSAFAALGDDLPRAGVELLAHPVDPLVRGEHDVSESFEPTSERTTKSFASSAISSSLRSRGSSIVPSETSTCEKRFSHQPAAVLVELAAGDHRLEERSAADDRRLERAVEGDLLLEVVRDVRGPPAELHDVDVVARGVEEPLDLAEVEALVHHVGQPLCPRLRRARRDVEESVRAVGIQSLQSLGRRRPGRRGRARCRASRSRRSAGRNP